MTKPRIIYDNVADNATVTMSSQAGDLGPDNMLTDTKSEVSRSVGTSLTITAIWTTSVLMGGVGLPFCNLSPTATIRVRGYTESADASPVFDTGTVLACPYAPLGSWTWGSVPLGVNAFSYGGGAYGSVWFAINSIKKIVVDLVDVDNTDGYIEVSRLVCGSYWTPTRGAEQGDTTLLAMDTSKQYRTDAGDLRVDLGCRYRKISINLKVMSPIDRSNFWRIVRGSGLHKPLFFSLFPDSDDPELEQAHQIYGRLSSINAISIAFNEIYSTTVEIEEN